MQFRRRWTPVFLLVLLFGLLSWGTFAFAAEVSSGESGSLIESSAGSSMVSSASSANSAVSSGEREFINTEPMSSLPSQTERQQYPIGTIAWIVILACVLVIILFICGARARGARARGRNAVEPRSAARSRWKKTRSSHAALNERYYHDRTHFRK